MASFLKHCALGLLLWHNFAIAHPHLRLAYQIQPLLASGALSGFHVSWQMDAPSSLQVRENIDLNQNSVLDPDELQAFADSNSPLMQPYNYFLTIEDGKSASHGQSTQEGACQESGSNFFDLHELTPLLGPLMGEICSSGRATDPDRHCTTIR